MTAIKSILFLLLVPGLLLVYFPFIIASTDVELFSPGIVRYLSFPLWLIGGTAMLWCFWNFTFIGKGAPAPLDPPKELVVVSLYRFVRNPMHVAGIIVLVGWVLWSPLFPLILAPVLFFTAAHLFVTFYEEPILKRKFGAAYEEYLKRVPRRIPKAGNYHVSIPQG